VAVFVLAVVLAVALGIGVGVLAWQTVLSTWRGALGPIALLATICFSTAIFLKIATGIVTYRNERAAMEEGALALYGRASTAKLHADVFRRLLSDPRMPARISALGLPASAPPEQRIMAVMQRGCAWLSDEQRAEAFEIRRALAAASPEVCASSWTGQGSPEALAPAMRTLDEDKQRAWIRIIARATELELAANSAPARVSREARDAALMEILGAMSQDERAAFERASASQKPTPEEACAGYRALSSGVMRVSPEAAALFRRIVFNPELI